MSLDSPTVRLELESRHESLTLIRSMLAGVADELGFEPELVDDLKTAVSEAANNVVLHAYGDGTGPLLVELQVTALGLDVLVADRGDGIQQLSSSAGERMGVGLAVISALADRAQFNSPPEGGTEVRMSFLGRGASAALVERAPMGGEREARLRLAGDVVVMLSTPSLLRGVLGRIARALAAGARFSLDRFSDLYLVTDALAAHANVAADRLSIGFAIATSTRRLELTLGPLSPGSGARLKAERLAPRPETPLALLIDDLEIETLQGTELLKVLLLDRGREPEPAA